MHYIAHTLSIGLCSIVSLWGSPLSFSQENVPNMKNETITYRLGSLIKVRPEFEERYIILHKHTFPGVLSRIRESNIRNYSIFLRDGILFSYYEYVGSNYDADMKAIGDPTTKEWWKLTDPMQEPLPTRKEGEWWASMDLLLESAPAMTPSSPADRLAFVAAVKPECVQAIHQFFKQLGTAFSSLLASHHLSNIHIYEKDATLYAYVEYTGASWPSDAKQMEQEVKTAEWKKEFERYTTTPWQSMKCVFHTN